jgi:hypothetical protein
MRPFLILVILFSCLFASTVELILDDNSFESESGWAIGTVAYEGQLFMNLPSLYAIMNAKVYIKNTNGQTHTLKIYDGDSWPNPIWLYSTSLVNPQIGWNQISLQAFHLGSCPNSLLVMVTIFYDSHIGIDTNGTIINNHRYHTESPNSWSIINHAIGVRLTIDNNPISINPTSLGSIKATFH